MTSILDIGEGGIDPQAEVKKLQDLVKKLETQNEVLRRKQKLSTSNDSNIIENNENEVLKPAVNNSVFYNTRKHSEKRDISLSNGSETLEGVDLIDVNTSVSGEEDSWLYTSPRPPTPQQNRVSPYKYMRQDLDNPSPDVQSARKSLKFKLDEAARMSRSSSTPAFQNYTTPPRNHVSTMSVSADSAPSPHTIKQPTVKPSMAYNSSIQGSRINTGTFTRPKKSKPPAPVEPVESDSKENIEAVHHSNVTDIENLAKMQEESLRQSIAQTSPRRGFRSRPLPNVGTYNNTDSNSVSSADSNRSSPARFEEGMNRRNSNNSVGSDHSSPPDSPYGSSQQLHVQNTGGSNLRGSAPNVSRLIPRGQHYNSDSSLADYEEQAVYNAEPPRYSGGRPQNQLPRPSSPSLSGLRQPNRNGRGPSPQRSGLPTPRRSIPRPGSAGLPRSGLQSPKRISGLPAPRLSQTRPRGNDDSWREGCF
ncbi:microtubule nucleation [Mactra antiquata]